MLLGVGIAIRGMWKGCFFEPIHLFFFSHLMALGACQLDLFGYRNGFSSGFYLVLLAGYTTFLIGALLGYHGTIGSGSGWGVNIGGEVLLGAAGIVSLFLLSLAVDGWPMLSANPTVVRLGLFKHFGTPQLFVLGVVGNLAIVSGAVLDRRPWLFLLAFAGLFEIALTGNRAQILQTLLFGLALYQLRWGKNLGKVMLAGGILFLSLFVLIGLRRETTSSVNGALATFNGAKMIYSYLCNGYWNFSLGISRVLEGTQSGSWGVSTFAGFWAWCLDIGALQRSFGWDTMAFNESTQKYFGLNSASYMWAMVKDFGISGMLLLNGIYAYGLVRLYRSAHHDDRLAILYAFFPHQLIVSFNILWSSEGLSSLTFIMVCVYAFFGRGRNRTVIRS